MRVVFMGTPEFAAATLRLLVGDDRFKIAAVVTQPDRPQGRGNKLGCSPVKEYALRQNLPVLQPLKARDPEFIGQLKSYEPEVIVVAAYGQILPQEILSLPRFGCLNVHASLLPKYRGAAPIHYAIMRGEKCSGITIMQMDRGLDTGGIIAQKAVSITEEMTMGELQELLQEAGARLLVSVLAALADGQDIQAQPQDDGNSSYAHLLTKETERIDWRQTAQETHNRVRGLNPSPGAYCELADGRKLKIWHTRVASSDGKPAAPGTVAALTKQGFTVACGQGVLEILTVQPAGKKMMSADVFCLGYRLEPGQVLL